MSKNTKGEYAERSDINDTYVFEICPDFQRGHVWDDAKSIAYVEFCLKGGVSARTLFFNCPGWQNKGPMQLVDGLQRLTAS